MSSSGSSAAFPVTRWTLIQEARGDASARRAALDELLAAYWTPLYVYARRKGLGAEDAQEAVQDLFADLLERQFPGTIDPARGRLRGWLKSCLDHHLVNRHAAATAQKRGGGARHVPLDTEVGERALAQYPGGAAASGPEDAYTRQWAAQVMERALARLGEEHREEARAGSFDVLLRFFGPGVAPAYRDVAAETGMSLPQLRAFLHRARVRYRALVLEEVAQTVANPEDAEREMAELLALLGG
ncbi:MAG: sigma-70 family RNA polymerase sigma factor [Pseudomonadota bacterium]|nr:sigma-70 family RNA polymerase sigma factor [Pseudomonadota bacterium]